MATNSSKEKMPYVFGSSTPRDFSYMDQIPAKYRIYNVRMKSENYQTSKTGGEDSTDQMTLKDFLREIRRAGSPQRAAGRRDRSADAANSRMFVFGSSTPRELSYLERVPHEFRLIDSVSPGKVLAAAGHHGGFSQEKRTAKIQYLNRRSSSISSTSNENTLSTPPKVTFSTPDGDHSGKKPHQNGTTSSTRSSRPRSARTRSVPASVSRVNAPQLSTENERMSRDISKKTKEITTKLSAQKTQKKKTPAKLQPASNAEKAKLTKKAENNNIEQRIEPKSPILVIQSSPEPLSKTDDDELTFSSPEPPKMVPASFEADRSIEISSNITGEATMGDHRTREVQVLGYESSSILERDNWASNSEKLQNQIFPDEFMISNHSKVPQMEDFHSIQMKLETAAQQHDLQEDSLGITIAEKLPENVSHGVNDSMVRDQTQIAETLNTTGVSAILETRHHISTEAQPDFSEKMDEVSIQGPHESPTTVIEEERRHQLPDENKVEYPSHILQFDDSMKSVEEPMHHEENIVEDIPRIDNVTNLNQDVSQNLETSSSQILQPTEDKQNVPVGVLKMNNDMLNMGHFIVDKKLQDELTDGNMTIEDVHPAIEAQKEDIRNFSPFLHGENLEPVPVPELVAQSDMQFGEPTIDAHYEVEDLEHPAMSPHKEYFEASPADMHDQILEDMHHDPEEQLQCAEPQKHPHAAQILESVPHSEHYENRDLFAEQGHHAMEVRDHVHPTDQPGESFDSGVEHSISVLPQILKKETELKSTHQEAENMEQADYDHEASKHLTSESKEEVQYFSGDMIRAPPDLQEEDIESPVMDDFGRCNPSGNQETVNFEKHAHPVGELRKDADALNDVAVSLDEINFDPVHEAHPFDHDRMPLAEEAHVESEISNSSKIDEYFHSVSTGFDKPKHHHYIFKDNAAVAEQRIHFETEEQRNILDQRPLESQVFVDDSLHVHPAEDEQEVPVQHDIEHSILATPFKEDGKQDQQIMELEHQIDMIQVDSSLVQFPRDIRKDVQGGIQSETEDFHQLEPSLLKKDVELAQEESRIHTSEAPTLASEMSAIDLDPHRMLSENSTSEMSSPHTKTPTPTPTSTKKVCPEEDILPQLLKKNFEFLNEEPYATIEVKKVMNATPWDAESQESFIGHQDQQEQIIYDEQDQHQYIVEEPATPNGAEASAIDSSFFDHMALSVVQDSIEEAGKHVSNFMPQTTEVEYSPIGDDFEQEKRVYSHAYDDEDSDQSGLELDQNESVEHHSNNVDDFSKSQSIILPVHDEVDVSRETFLDSIQTQHQDARKSPISLDDVDVCTTAAKLQADDPRKHESDDSGVQDIFIYRLQKHEDNLNNRLDFQPEASMTITDPQIFDKRFQYGEDFFAPNVVAQSLASPKHDNELLEKNQDFDDQMTKSHESLIKDYSDDFCENSTSSSVESAKQECETTARMHDSTISPKSLREEDDFKNQSFDKGFETDDERGVWKRLTLNESGINERMDLTADDNVMPSSSIKFDTVESEMESFYTKIETSEPMAQQNDGRVVEPDQAEVSIESSTFRPFHEESLFPQSQTNGKSGHILGEFSQFDPSSSDDDRLLAHPTTTAVVDEFFPTGILKKQSSSNLENTNNNNKEFFFSAENETDDDDDDDSSPINFSKMDFDDSSTSPAMTSSKMTSATRTTAISRDEEQQQQRKKIFHFQSEEMSSDDEDDENNGNITVEFEKFVQNSENVDLPEVQFKKSSKFGENGNQSRI